MHTPAGSSVEELIEEQAVSKADAEVCSIPAEHHCVFCPTCSSRLQDSRCKLVCRTCGYFLSCADFY